MAVEISDKQYSTCKEANGQFSSIYTPFQPLAIHLLALQHYIPRMPPALLLDVHYRLEKLKPSAYSC